MAVTIDGVTSFDPADFKRGEQSRWYRQGKDPWKAIQKEKIKGCCKAWRYSEPVPESPPHCQEQEGSKPDPANYLLGFYDLLAMIQAPLLHAPLHPQRSYLYLGERKNMEDMPITAIRLHTVAQGQIVDLVEEYDVDELGGTIPVVGDLMVSPGVVAGLDRRKPENRTIHEVVSRYFLPGAHSDSRYIAIVVKERPALESESNIACIS